MSWLLPQPKTHFSVANGSPTSESAFRHKKDIKIHYGAERGKIRNSFLEREESKQNDVLICGASSDNETKTKAEKYAKALGDFSLQIVCTRGADRPSTFHFLTYTNYRPINIFPAPAPPKSRDLVYVFTIAAKCLLLMVIAREVY